MNRDQGDGSLSPDINWEEIDWDDLIPRLFLYTRGRLHRGMRWRNKYDGSIPGGCEIEDFVHKAIIKTISGERKWDSKERTIFKHLTGVISSEINHLSESKENELGIDGDDVLTTTSSQQLGFGFNPEQIAIAESEQIVFLEYLRCVDPQLKQLAELILSEGFRGSIEISNELGISVKNVNNLKKRLKRALKSYIQGRPFVSSASGLQHEKGRT